MAERPVLLVHGGLAERMDAVRFWVEPGIVGELERHGVEVLAPDRDTTPPSWSAAAATMADLLTGPSTVVAGSNGVSVALRMAIEHHHLVARLVLAWPATAGDPRVDATVPPAARHLLDGGTVRGVTDDELGSLAMPVAIVRSAVENPAHQHVTIDRLSEHLPDAVVCPVGYPEAPRPDFLPHLGAFVATLLPHL